MTPADRRLVEQLRQACAEDPRALQLVEQLGGRLDDAAEALSELASLASETLRLQEAERSRTLSKASAFRARAAALEMEGRLVRELERLGFLRQVKLPGT